MTRARCFDTAPRAQHLRLVVEHTDDGEELLECGHVVVPAFAELDHHDYVDENDEPLPSLTALSYRRHCPKCDPGEQPIDTFFPAGGGLAYERAQAAKQICNGAWGVDPCPVRDDCLAYAVYNDIRHGIWGGASHRQRDAHGIHVHEQQQQGSDQWLSPPS